MRLWLALLLLLAPTAVQAGVTLSGPFILPEDRGGFGISVTGQSGYPKNTAGAFAFSTTIPGADLVLTATTCTNQFVSAISIIGVGTCTTDTLASAQHANQGTATTLLHGNAAGNPSWSAVVSADLNITTTTCTNQFIRSLSSGAVGTCASVANADLTNSTITLNAGTSTGLTAPGAMSLGSTYTIGAITDDVQFARIGLGVAPTYDVSVARSSASGTSGTFPGIRARNTSTATGSLADIMAESTTAASVAVQVRLLTDGFGGSTFVNSSIAGGVGTRSNHDLYIATNNTAQAKLSTAGVLTLLSYGTGLLHSSSAGVITSSAVDIASADVTGVLLGANGGTGVANTSKTITLGGNLTTSGAFATTFTVTNTTSVTLPTTGTLTVTANDLSVFAATTSAQLRGVLSDETGTGLAVFATSPTLTTGYTVSTGGTNTVKVGQNASATTYNAISLNGTLTDPAMIGLAGGGGADTNLYFEVPTGGAFKFRVNAVAVGVSQTFTMCKTGACITTCTIIVTDGLTTGGTC